MEILARRSHTDSQLKKLCFINYCWDICMYLLTAVHSFNAQNTCKISNTFPTAAIYVITYNPALQLWMFPSGQFVSFAARYSHSIPFQKWSSSPPPPVWVLTVPITVLTADPWSFLLTCWHYQFLLLPLPFPFLTLVNAETTTTDECKQSQPCTTYVDADHAGNVVTRRPPGSSSIVIHWSYGSSASGRIS